MSAVRDVVVLGAGLAGVTSAWYLRAAGHRVTVIERRAGPALETSFANGGQISASHPEPWSNPRTPLAVLRGLGRSDAPVRLRFGLEAERWRWGLAFLGQCRPGPTRRNTATIARLAAYSLAALRQLRRQLDLDYDASECGILHLYFTETQLRHGRRMAATLAEFGLRTEVLGDAAACHRLEPALSRAPDLAGGLYAPEDESGDAHRFVEALTGHCRQAGVRFEFGMRVDRIATRGQTVRGVHVTDAEGRSGFYAGTDIVCALGAESSRLAKPLGERLPIYPLKGYSVTIPAGPAAPHLSLTDELHRIVVSRLGDRVRIAGMAELVGFDTGIDTSRAATLLKRASALMPELMSGLGHAAAPQYWAGLRPATPGNVPIIGRGRVDGLWYNTGHGSLGWTLACGSAELLSALLSGAAPAIAFPFWNG